MNNEEFKFQVAGPYCPVETIDVDGYLILRKPEVATLKTSIELANLYLSVLQWRKHNSMMAKSMCHAATMMGEVDDPVEYADQQSYTHLGYAGLFSIFFVFQVIDTHDSKKNRALNDDIKKTAIGIITQLLFALQMDDDALAQYARHKRTGFTGSPSDVDMANTNMCREFVRKISRLSEEMEAAFLANQYDIPLQKRLWGYDRERGHCWSQPIEIPRLPVNEDEY